MCGIVQTVAAGLPILLAVTLRQTLLVPFDST
jgi:hypothetical protein